MMELKAVIDRFEGDVAVLLVGRDETSVNWPRRELPATAKEGDVLAFTLRLDEAATRAAKGEAAELLRQLTAQKRE